MVRAAIVVMGMLSAAVAQYNGPAFNPDTAPNFGEIAPGVPTITMAYPVNPVPTLSDAVPTTVVTPTFIPPSVSSVFMSAASPIVSRSVIASMSAPANSTTMISSSSVAQSSSASLSSSFSTSASRTASVTSSASLAAQSTGAAIANVPGVVGAIAGGLFAGLAML